MSDRTFREAARELSISIELLDPDDAARVVVGALCVAGLCLPESVVASIAAVARPVLARALALLADGDLSHVVVPPLRRAQYLSLEDELAGLSRDTDPVPAPPESDGDPS